MPSYHQSYGFRKIIDTKEEDAFEYSGFFTIVLTSIERNYVDPVRRILQDCWELYIVNVNVITYDATDYEKAFMYTYFPYTSEHCGKVNPIVYGVFWNETQLEGNQIFPEKVGNFYSCNLTIGTFSFPPYITFELQENSSYTFYGFEGILSKVLGQRLNFSLALKISNEGWGKVNGENSTGMCGMV